MVNFIQFLLDFGVSVPENLRTVAKFFSHLREEGYDVRVNKFSEVPSPIRIL